MKRVSVVGSSGSGKTIVASRVAAALAVPHIELDALHWGPDWTPATPEDFKARVEAATATDRWVIDGNYWSKTGPQVWNRADTIIWVNPPRWRAISQSISRIIRRAATRQQLWNGNRERWRGLMFWRGEESILWWAWTAYGRTQRRHTQAIEDPQWAHLKFHQLRTRREVDRFVAQIASGGPRGD